MKRKIISIDEEKCTGCGLCVPDCPEGAFRIIDGKARLVGELFCDGLGACIKSCPQNALSVTEREAEPYDERRVMANIVPQGINVIKAHLQHLLDHGEDGLYNEACSYLTENNIKIDGIDSFIKIHEFQSCPGAKERSINRERHEDKGEPAEAVASELRQWPVQLKLLNPAAPYFDNADLLIAADCTPFAYGDFHRKFLRGRIVIMFCPKLDKDIDEYIDKIAAVLAGHEINSITVLRMEVPCCGGVNYVLDRAMEKSGKKIPVQSHVISIKGEAG